MISRKQSEALRLTVAHYVPILLMMLSTIINYHIRLVKAECCFVMAPSKLQELDYYVNITSQSSLMKNFTRQTASITFPRDYITDREIPSGPNGLICQKDLTDMVQLNRWICAVTNSRTIQVRFRSAMPNSNPPVAQVSMYNEDCRQETARCTINDSDGLGGQSGGGNDSSYADKYKGMIDLGALGFAKPEVFYPIVVLAIFGVLGLAFFAYYRTKRSKQGPQQSPSNGFGRSGNVKQKQLPSDVENQLAANEMHAADNSGYASFAAARKQLKVSHSGGSGSEDNSPRRHHSSKKRHSTLLQDVTPPAEIATPQTTNNSSLNRSQSHHRRSDNPRRHHGENSPAATDSLKRHGSHHRHSVHGSESTAAERDTPKRQGSQHSSSRKQYRRPHKPLVSFDDK